MEKKMNCSICKQVIEVESNGWDLGNSAEPINDGRCCNDCNSTWVIPERIKEMAFAREVQKDLAAQSKFFAERSGR
jgi:hypothetical protein|tara:strand:- start:1335 stop:1562 length:228 start_codon:yes stop_codon:yes gene_type:complete